MSVHRGGEGKERGGEGREGGKGYSLRLVLSKQSLWDYPVDIHSQSGLSEDDCLSTTASDSHCEAT